MIGVVLVNVSKGSEVGAVFTGSQAIFGGAGPGTFLNKVTSGLAIVFFTTSLVLTYFSAKKSTGSLMEKAPAVEEKVPIPAVPKEVPVPESKPQPENVKTPEASKTSQTSKAIPTPPHP